MDKPTSSEPTDPETLTEHKQVDATTYDPQVILISGAIGLLLLFIRIGPFSFILVIIVSFTLSASPDFRSIVDSTLGTTLSPERRLAETFSVLGIKFESSHLANLESSQSNYHQQLNQNPIELDQLPEQLQSAFVSLFDLIINKYVESWYLLPTVSTGDKAFLNQLRNALNHILLKAHAKLTTKSSKETMIYLIGCLSMNLVRELNDRANSKSQTSSEDRIAQRLTQTRRISEEILLTLGSSSITSSPLTLNLVSEVLTVQLISITSSFNQDWFNQTLIDSLGAGTTAQATLVSASTKATDNGVTAALVDQIKEGTKQNDNHRSLFQSPSPARSHSTSDTPSTIAATPDDIQSVTGSDVLMAYLKSPANFNLSPSTKPNSNIRLQDLFQHTAKWAPQNAIVDSERSSLLSSSPHDSVQVECFVKLFNHFDSFHKTCQSANLKSDVVKVDAISVLSALAPLMDYAVDHHIANQPDQSSKVRISSTWKSVIIETLRRLELASSSGSPVFENLQQWILDRLRSIRSNPSDQASAASSLGSSSNIDHQPWTTQAAQATRGDKIHYMSLPNIPAASSNGYIVDSPPMQSQDLAGVRDEHTWDKAKNSTTEAILSSHRTPSGSRTAISPPPRFGASSRRDSIQESFGSPVAALHSSTFSQSSPFSARVPEEGDMTEGYSLEETSENEDSDPNQSNQPINPPYSLSTSHSTVRFEDTNTFFSPISRSNSINTPPASQSSQSVSFSVSVTDMSLPSATDPKTGLIKQKKEISLLIAVEAPSVPGFIVTRGWPELERMDLAINKKKLVGVGTKAFPRALLPTNLNFKTIDHVRRELEAYLECLLNDERYSKSEPVLKFFAKERSGMSGRGGAINNIFNTTSSTLDSIGKGVASVGKEVVSKPVDFAASGLNRLSKGVFSGLPFGNSPVTINEDSASSELGRQTDALPLANPTSSNLVASEPTDQTTSAGEGLVNTRSTIAAHHSGGNEDEGAVDHNQKETKEDSNEQSVAAPRNLNLTTLGSRPISTVIPLPSVPPTEEKSSLNSPLQDLQSTARPERPGSVGGTTTKNQETVVASNLTDTSKPTTTPGNNTKSTAPLNATASSLPVSSATAATTLNAKEFDTVIIGIISILEAAYGLDQKQGGSGSNTPWSMKRGVLRVLETVLRTTSFSHFIRLTLSQLIDKFEKVETYVDLINSALLSLSSPSSSTNDYRGHSSDEQQTFKNKRKHRKQKSLASLASEDYSLDDFGLEISSSPSESSEAVNQPHRYQYQSLIDDDEPKNTNNLNQAKIDQDPEVKAQRKKAARKLFVESWSNLKIGLGSNATDLAASKVFDLFQELDNCNHHQEDEIKNYEKKKVDQCAQSQVVHLPSGIEFIVHNLLLDLIRIILLL